MDPTIHGTARQRNATIPDATPQLSIPPTIEDSTMSTPTLDRKLQTEDEGAQTDAVDEEAEEDVVAGQAVAEGTPTAQATPAG